MTKRRVQQNEPSMPAAQATGVELADMVLTLHRLEQHLSNPRTLAALGAEPREFRYALASFRQRHAAVWQLTSQGEHDVESGRHQDTQ